MPTAPAAGQGCGGALALGGPFHFPVPGVRPEIHPGRIHTGRVWQRSTTEVHPAEATVPKGPNIGFIVTFLGTQLRRHTHGHSGLELSQALCLWVLGDPRDLSLGVESASRD